MTDEPRLKECPWCAGEAKLYQENEAYGLVDGVACMRYWVRCANEKCELRPATDLMYEHAPHAVAAWNNRQPCPECAALREQLAKRDADVTQLIRQRDYAEEMADHMAALLAPENVVGEHSSMNDPWQNAVEWAESKGATE